MKTTIELVSFDGMLPETVDEFKKMGFSVKNQPVKRLWNHFKPPTLIQKKFNELGQGKKYVLFSFVIIVEDQYRTVTA